MKFPFVDKLKQSIWSYTLDNFPEIDFPLQYTRAFEKESDTKYQFTCTIKASDDLKGVGCRIPVFKNTLKVTEDQPSGVVFEFDSSFKVIKVTIGIMNKVKECVLKFVIELSEVTEENLKEKETIVMCNYQKPNHLFSNVDIRFMKTIPGIDDVEKGVSKEKSAKLKIINQ